MSQHINDKLIYGRDLTQKIVSLEVRDNSCELFIQEGNKVVSKFIENQYWILTSRPFSGHSFATLKGDLHYKYGKQFKTRKSFLDFRRQYRDRDIFSVYDEKESIMVKNGLTYYKGLKPSDVSILSFDIETTTLEHNDNSKLLLISNTFRDSFGNKTRKLFAYDDYNDEGEMIDDWCRWVRKIDPSIITGHNINSFDLRYLAFIADKYNVPLKLGRDGSKLYTESYESKFRKDGNQFYHYHKSKIYGREIIDTMFLSIKYDIGRKYESYALKQIVKQEGLEQKGRVFYDAATIRHNYKKPEEWVKIKAYAEFDADDALSLFDLMATPQFYWTQMVPMSFQKITESATGSQINALMNRSYIQEMHSIPKADQIDGRFEGAISAGSPGIYKNCIKWDVASLYPSIILQYKIYCKEKDPNGNFLRLVETLTEERLKNKKLAKDTGNQYYKDLEQSQKIGVNSSYGFLGASGLNFNYLAGASKVTEHGREILKTAIKWATGKDYELSIQDE